MSDDLSPARTAAVAGFVAAAVREARDLDDTMAKVDEVISRTRPVDLNDVLAKRGVLTDENLQKARSLVDVTLAGSPPPQRARIEAELRTELADQLKAVRHRNKTHPATPDTYFWGITVAERIIRGDHP